MSMYVYVVVIIIVPYMHCYSVAFTNCVHHIIPYQYMITMIHHPYINTCPYYSLHITTVTSVSVDGSTLFWEKPAGTVSHYTVIISGKDDEQVVLNTTQQHYKIPEHQRKYTVQV